MSYLKEPICYHKCLMAEFFTWAPNSTKTMIHILSNHVRLCVPMVICHMLAK